MKSLKYILFAAAFVFLLAGCDSNDDGFYNRVYVDADNLVDIIPTGDNYFEVAATIPRLIPEEGETELLDLRATTGNASSFEFSFVIEKLNNGNWEAVDLSGDIVNVVGDVLIGSFVQAEAEWDSDLDAYYFRGGVEIAEPGEYRLSYGYNSTSVEVVELISRSTNNNIFVNIFSTSEDINGDGYYLFTID